LFFAVAREGYRDLIVDLPPAWREDLEAVTRAAASTVRQLREARSP